MDEATVLITGTSSGFGKLIATTLAGEGHRVFAGMRDVAGRNAHVAAELAAAPAAHPITAIEIDVTDGDSVATGVQRVLDSAGEIDVLVNNAGVMWLGTTEAYSVEQFETLLQTNLIGPFRMFKAVLPGMRKRGDGLLVTVTSLAGRSSAPAFGIYGASKNGLEALAEVMGLEISGLGIDSVIVEPGPFPTTNLGSSQQDPAASEIIEAYGDCGRFLERIWAGAGAALNDNPALMDPQLVADAVRDLVAAPKGTRPVRVPVGLTFGLDGLNDATRDFQRGFLGALGLAETERVAATA